VIDKPTTPLTRPNPEFVRLISHALGLDMATHPYRKHYVAPAGGECRILCEHMAAAGWLRPFGEPDRNGTQCFHVTQLGADLIGQKLP
jgi:hypothetical protein